MSSLIFHAQWLEDTLFVRTQFRRLSPPPSEDPLSLDTSFDCGYEGERPRILARALLSECLHTTTPPESAVEHIHQIIVAQLPRKLGWKITEQQLRDALAGSL